MCVQLTSLLLTVQVAEILVVLERALGLLQATICFASVHAATLQPDALVRWLEVAVRLRSRVGDPDGFLVGQGSALLQLVHQLLQPQRPDCSGDDHIPVGEAPGKVSAKQWREGAVRLQREVSHCL
jgi:hypothetical protein